MNFISRAIAPQATLSTLDIKNTSRNVNSSSSKVQMLNHRENLKRKCVLFQCDMDRNIIEVVRWDNFWVWYRIYICFGTQNPNTFTIHMMWTLPCHFNVIDIWILIHFNRISPIPHKKLQLISFYIPISMVLHKMLFVDEFFLCTAEPCTKKFQTM